MFLLFFLGLSLPAGSILNTDPLALVQNLMIVNEKKKNVCTGFIKETVRETHTHCTPCSSLLVMQPPPGRCTHLENSQITTIRPLVLWTLMHPYYSKVLTGKLSWDHDVFLQIRGGIPAIVTHHVCFLFELNLV